MINTLFYIFMLAAIFSALIVIFAKNSVQAVVAKIVTFLAVSMIWFLMQQEYCQDHSQSEE